MKIEDDKVILHIEEHEHIIFGIGKYKKVSELQIWTGFIVYTPFGPFTFTRSRNRLAPQVEERTHLTVTSKKRRKV